MRIGCAFKFDVHCDTSKSPRPRIDTQHATRQKSRKFANSLEARGCEHPRVVIHNAAMIAIGKKTIKTSDGYEVHAKKMTGHVVALV